MSDFKYFAEILIVQCFLDVDYAAKVDLCLCLIYKSLISHLGRSNLRNLDLELARGISNLQRKSLKFK